MSKKLKINQENRSDSKNTVIWTRVSTKYQEENGGSLDYQKGVCEQYASSKGFNIVDYYGGKHESAKTPGDMIKSMISAVKKDKSIKYIIVSEFDRFSRNTEQALSILAKLRECGVVVISAKTGQDSSTKDGLLMTTISLALAQYDNSTRVDKFMSGRKDCLLKGVWVERAPMGYYKEGKSKNTICRLNDTGKLIRQAFLWKLNLCSNSEILEKLNTRGLHISKQQLHKILTNPFYAGKVKHKLIDNQIVDGVHELAITYVQFLKVQDILSGKTGKYKQNIKRADCPLSKHVYCVHDNKPLSFYLVQKKNGYKYGYYKCNATGCHTNIKAEVLHDNYRAVLANYDIPAVLTPILKDIISELIAENGNEVNSQEILLKKRLTEVETQIKGVKMRFATGLIENEIFSDAIQELENRRGKILLELEDCVGKISNSKAEVDEIIATCCKLSVLWNSARLETQQRIQNLVFPNGIIWDANNSQYLTQNMNSVLNLFDEISSSYEKGTEVDCSTTVPLCGRRDSNPHASRRQILSLVRLPITPRPHVEGTKVMQFSKNAN